MTADWLIPTLIYLLLTGALGITTKYALVHLRWQDLILWSGIGYVLLGILLLALGDTQVQFVDGSGWAALGAAAVIAALFAFYVALTVGEAGVVVPVSASYPVVTLVLSAIFLSEKIEFSKAIGAILVIGGVVILTIAVPSKAVVAGEGTGAPAPPPDAAPSAARPAVLAWLLPTLIFVFGLGGLGVTSKKAFEHLVWQDLVLWSSIGYLLVVIVMIALNYARPKFVPGTFWAIMSAVAAIVGLVALYIALSKGEASTVVPISAAYPAVTLVLSAVFLGEKVTWSKAAGVVLVIGGVVLVTSG